MEAAIARRPVTRGAASVRRGRRRGRGPPPGRSAPDPDDHFTAAAFQSFVLGVTPTIAYFPFLTCERMMLQ